MDPCHDLDANQPIRIPDEHWTGTPKEMHERADQIMPKEFTDGSTVAHKFYLHRITNTKASSPYIADPALKPSRGPAGQ